MTNFALRCNASVVARQAAVNLKYMAGRQREEASLEKESADARYFKTQSRLIVSKYWFAQTNKTRQYLQHIFFQFKIELFPQDCGAVTPEYMNY